jgi:hypothetical protein
MNGDRYAYADELLGYLAEAKQAGERVVELALERNGPMTAAERREMRDRALDISRWLDDAKIAVETLKDEM